MFSHFGTDDEAEEAQAAIGDIGGPGAIVPVDHVQEMLARAGVGSGGESSRTHDPVTQTKAGDLNRLLSFDSPILSRPATFASRPLTARSPKQETQRSLEGRREGTWAEDEKHPQLTLTLDADTHREAGPGTPERLFPETPQGPLTRQSLIVDAEEKVDGMDAESMRRLSRSPTLILRSHGPLPPLSPSVPSLIAEPTGFLTGAGPVNVSTRGFLGRLARNIERSKAKKAEKDRLEEMEKLKQRSSRSATRRSSQVRPEGSRISEEASSPLGSRPHSKRGSFSAHASGNGGTTERRLELERLSNEPAEPLEDDTACAERLKVQFELQRSHEEKKEAEDTKKDDGEEEVKEEYRPTLVIPLDAATAETTHVEAFTMPQDDVKEAAAPSDSSTAAILSLSSSTDREHLLPHGPSSDLLDYGLSPLLSPLLGTIPKSPATLASSVVLLPPLPCQTGPPASFP